MMNTNETLHIGVSFRISQKSNLPTNTKCIKIGIKCSNFNIGSGYAEKKVIVYINVANSVIPAKPASSIFNYPEYMAMPIDAVRDTKLRVDEFLGSTDDVLYIFTVSSDVVSFVYNYGSKMNYAVTMFYRKKRVGIETAFKIFNRVFEYSDKLTSTEK